MKGKTSTLCRHKRRRRSPSSTSPDGRKHELSDLENNPSKHDGGKSEQKASKIRSDDSSGSEPDVGGNVEKSRKRHINPKSYNSRNSDSEEENYVEKKSRTSHSHRTGNRYTSKSDSDIDKSRSRERESKNSRTGHARRRDRRYDDNGEGTGRRRDGGNSRNIGRKIHFADTDRRAHDDERHQVQRNEGYNRSRDGKEFNSRDTDKHVYGDERRKRWSDGGEGSRPGGSRGGRMSGDVDQLPSYDRNRPIKQEPGVNNDEGENYEWGKNTTGASKPWNNIKKEKDEEKDKPNFGLSGKLTEDTNTVNGVVIKYSEPPEARKPRRRWRLYVFKGEENLPTLYLHRQSAFLIGRDRKVVDIPVDHPSCSKQHAAFQFRLVPYQRPNGTMGKRVRPYIIDLESSNGTFVNNNRIDAKKYVELLERDVMKFGFSSREYVLLHEQSKESEGEDDDVVGT